MFRKLFLDHPSEVGEGYAQHFVVASGFGVTMIIGGLGALVCWCWYCSPVAKP